MAPIRVPVEDTLKTLQSVLKRRADAYRVLKNRKAPDGEDYRRREKEHDKKQYLQPSNSDNTKASIYYTRMKFIRYCAKKGITDWRKALRAKSCTKGTMMEFLRWICETYVVPKLKRGKKTKRKTINQYWRDLKMLFRRANSAHVDTNDSYEVVKFINSSLTHDYKLDIMPKSKPVARVDELLLLLTHHWARDESVYSIEDDRLDVATITLFLAYTGARPAEFVHASKGHASKDPLGEAEESEERGQAVASSNNVEVDDEDLYNSYEKDLFDSEDEET